MAICQYYLKGRCKFGDKCRFEHPPISNTQQKHTQKYHSIDSPSFTDIIRSDLIFKTPEYNYSAYSNEFAKEKNLIEGDISPEELRFRAYSEGRQFGHLNEYNAFVAQVELYHKEKRDFILANPTAFVIERATGVDKNRNRYTNLTTADSVHLTGSKQNVQMGNEDGSFDSSISQQTISYARVFPLPCEEDIKAFQSAVFEFQKIPELPPTPDLCFPV